jgi:hypothetical protein
MWISCGVNSSPGSGDGGGGGGVTPPAAQVQGYSLIAWSELGMHCMDGKDYSVFSVLPPYNTIHAQLVKNAEPPVVISSGITVTYESVSDSKGSINASSAGKTNFWNWVAALFHNNAAPEIGLAGAHTQSTTAQPMTWVASLGVFEALGVPTVPYDDTGARNPYPMAKIMARDTSGTILATTTVVLSVSDEMNCVTCHASGSNAAAQPAAGWENNPDSAKDVKFNILKKHDDRWSISGNLAALQAAGYNYKSSLYQTAKSGTPILCAACHGTNALGAAGVAGVRPLTADMHTMHATVLNPSTGRTLDNGLTPFESCYVCHPGQITKCQRGAMNQTACYNCHGNLAKVGAASRNGWLDVPSCQMCHTSGARYPTTFDNFGNFRAAADLTFATNPNVPSAGFSLYRFSAGHGNLYCSACHGSQHAEYPTLQDNDNVSSINLQGYAGQIRECGVCHSAVPTTQTGGPHGMHTVGSNWVSSHRSYAHGSGYTACAYCHGANYTGTPLSKTLIGKTFSVEGRNKSFAAGHEISCYDCHDGPNGD